MKKAAWLLAAGMGIVACKTEVVPGEAPAAPLASGDAGGAADVVSEPERDASPLVCPPAFEGFSPLVGPPASSRRAACTDAEIEALVRACLESSDRFEDAACTGIATDCARCMMSQEKDATWGPVVRLGDASMHGFVVNQAGCIEKATGLAGCGESIVAYSDCLGFACSGDTCPKSADREACRAAAETSPQCLKLAPTAACIAAYEGKAKACVAAGKTGFVTAMKAFCQAP